MSAPLLFSTCFGGPDSPYPRLARVLTSTADRCCPTWRREIEVAPPPPPHRNPSSAFIANTHKMTRWCHRLAQAADGEAILFVDTDTAIARSLDDLWAQPFDLAYTVKAVQRYPFNTGVVAIRVGPAVRTFFARWHAETLRMLDDTRHHQTWRRQCGGIHQAALGALFHQGAERELAIARLPCREWNCEDTNWGTFDPRATRILHVKSTLRRAILGFAPAPPAIRNVVRWYREAESAIRRAEQPA